MDGALRKATPLLILAAIWAAASRGLDSPMFPSPIDVGAALARAAASGELPRAVARTGLRLVVGYAVALAVGVCLGVVLARAPRLRRAIAPLLHGLSGVPSVCWLPLSVLWFGLSEAAIQVVVVVGAALPIASATEAAVRQVPPIVDRAARAMGARGPSLLFRVLLPAAMPGITSGARLGWTFALRSLMAGELLFVSGGLGQLLEAGRDLGDAALVLGVVVVIVALGRAVETTVFGRVDRAVARRWGTVAA